MGRLEPAGTEPAPAGLTATTGAPESDPGPMVEHEVKELRDPEVQYEETDGPASKLPLTAVLTTNTIPTVLPSDASIHQVAVFSGGLHKF